MPGQQSSLTGEPGGRSHRRLPAVLALVLLSAGAAGAQRTTIEMPLEVFARAAVVSRDESQRALDLLAENWKPGYAAMILDLAELSRPSRRYQPQDIAVFAGSAISPREDPDREPAPPLDEELAPRATSPVRERLLRFLERQTRQRFGHDFERWHRWIWSLPYEPHTDLARFKGLLYANIDPRMREFFPPGVAATIRLDEIEWGGVTVNGIPPLIYPKHVSADTARYLRDDHIVFGFAVNGKTRAYPKRILGWHELARDRVGGVELTIVYCTLCGTVMPYESVTGDQLQLLGTSGLLYRSNKLMFDERTNSLWSTLEGKPVVGPLVGSGLELRVRPAVTTTWGEWRRQHPTTTVLSLDTGYRRDYSEGAAYRDYFSTDRLMFTVPETDTRLKNKAEVLVMRLEAPAAGERATPVAISSEFLKKRPVYQIDLAGRRLVVVTSRNGANRVYQAGLRHFVSSDGDGRLIDDRAVRWLMTEDALVSEGTVAERLPRISAQRAFWFGWHAQYPHTVLIK